MVKTEVYGNTAIEKENKKRFFEIFKRNTSHKE